MESRISSVVFRLSRVPKSRFSSTNVLENPEIFAHRGSELEGRFCISPLNSSLAQIPARVFEGALDFKVVHREVVPSPEKNSLRSNCSPLEALRPVI